jgi:sigma-B regulation protein RsbU (phosphoserine phosphatase)
VALLLILMGAVGFFYARNSLLSQWREAALLKLQRAAHQVDMRLDGIKQWMRIFNNASGELQSGPFPLWLVDQLKKQQGVVAVNLAWFDAAPGGGSRSDGSGMMGLGARGHMMGSGSPSDRPMRMRRFHGARIQQLTPPRYDPSADRQTVSLVSELSDASGRVIGRFEVILSFDFLIQNVLQSGWWQSENAFLVDVDGRILTSTTSTREGRLGDSGDALELATSQALRQQASGTLLGEGHPPQEVSGFCRLQEAPWSLVMMAPGKKILAPVVRFRFIYFTTVAAFILVILLLIRSVIRHPVAAIREVSQAAGKVARGDLSDTLPVRSRDEVGELTRSFNTMVAQLRDRWEMKEAMNLAMEVQQKFLPRRNPQVQGLDIAGRSIYCDETGGDYFDFIEHHHRDAKQIGIAVGDVAGHGIPAALLMTSVRAFLRSRARLGGNLADIVSDVNRLVGRDTAETGQFMTLFYGWVDAAEKTMHWVRAGHDPALVYDPTQGTFEELLGTGAALGIDGGARYEENILKHLSNGQLILIGTDGLWEARNPSGEMFGKERLKRLVVRHAGASADRIIDRIIDSVAAFRDSGRQEDDVTLVVIKISPGESLYSNLETATAMDGEPSAERPDSQGK